MVASKVQSEQEIIRWFEQGKTYQWMVEEYKRKYDIDVVPSFFGNFRRRHGLERRVTRNEELMPWFVQEQHRSLFPAQMLRAEARRREGKELKPAEDRRLQSFLKRLKDEGLVVHYDPDTDEGWFYVPARPDIDTDLIRRPARKTTPRPKAD
ncbi:hypothetical protein [Micromonospora sp. NPDC049240]|uniref:hypothetical protein n=1 Tax=Micromonospora sp. NPDC049240 TaxID=3155151 RepID=UPI00340A4478